MNALSPGFVLRIRHKRLSSAMVCGQPLRAFRFKIAKHRGSGAPDRTAQLLLENRIKACYFYSFLSGSAAIWYQNSLRRFSYIYETILYEF